MDIGTEHKVNPLLECAAQLFALAAPLRAGREAQQNLPEDFREQVLAGFDVLERMTFERQIDTATVQEAKFALAAFVDESVMASEWPGRLDWMSRPLQLEFFGEHTAGERFFERLNKLRHGGEQNIDLLELYYVCLQLGFEGIYKVRGLEQLLALQVDLRGQIDAVRGVADPRLAPDGVVKNSVLARVGRQIPYWVIGAVTLAALVLGYGAYTAATYRATDRSLAAIERDIEFIAAYGAANTRRGEQR